MNSQQYLHCFDPITFLFKFTNVRFRPKVKYTKKKNIFKGFSACDVLMRNANL